MDSPENKSYATASEGDTGLCSDLDAVHACLPAEARAFTYGLGHVTQLSFHGSSEGRSGVAGDRLPR